MFYEFFLPKFQQEKRASFCHLELVFSQYFLVIEIYLRFSTLIMLIINLNFLISETSI